MLKRFSFLPCAFRLTYRIRSSPTWGLALGILAGCTAGAPLAQVQDGMVVADKSANGVEPPSDPSGSPGRAATNGNAGDAGNAGNAGDAAATEVSPNAADATAADAAVPPYIPVVDCSKGSPNDAPRDLACTGLYEPGSLERIAPGVRAYAPGVTLFSDGAQKRRWVLLPPGTQIDTQDMDRWVFPVGTKFWKEFSFGATRIETRYFTKVAATRWVGTTYRWSDAPLRALRLRSGERQANGLVYDIPNEVQCETCHAGHPDHVLGFEAVGLGLDAAEGLTLAQLVAEGRLSSPPKATRYMLPEDGTGKAATALGWMHANCGNSCHNRYEAAGATFMGLWLRLSAAPLLRPAGPSASSVDATTTDTYQTTVNQLPKLGSFLSDSRWKRIVPGKPEQSQLFEMVRLPRDAAATTMPPLGMRTHDTLAIEALRAWIAAMPAAGPHP